MMRNRYIIILFGLGYILFNFQYITGNMKEQDGIEIAVFGGGCFWCTEAIFQDINGVITVESGYSGGQIKNPTYKEVCSGRTGHAEVVRITYNPKKV